MTFLWEDGYPVAVETDNNGLPQQFLWQGRKHEVQRVTSHWRIDEGWWFQRIWRDYFKLTTDTGLLLTIFLDLQADEWYVQRLYD